MATKKKIKAQLKIALDEVGQITPVYDESIEAWVFSHINYPVECSGETPQEVIHDYPKYLEEFIKQRLSDNLNPLIESKTKGRGGKRPGAGRPLGTKKEEKKRVYLPIDIADWVVMHQDEIRKFKNQSSG